MRNVLSILLLLCVTICFACTGGASNGGSKEDSLAAGMNGGQATEARNKEVADGNVVLPSDPGFRYVGRISFKNPDAPRMGFSGAQIFANFEGTSVSMLAKPNSGFYVAVIDGKKPIKVQSKKDTTIVIAKGLEKGMHSIVIAQDTEAADVDFPEFYGLKLDKGCALGEAPVLPERKIEFIGNSITCGKGALDTTTTKSVDDIAFESWYDSYDAEVGRNLNAQCMVVARSGIGIYRNNGGKKTGDPDNMQFYHQRTLLTQDSEMWDFSKFQPQVVCINLGTNDTAQQYDVKLLENGAKTFFADVRKRYPQAKIVVMTGPMRSGKRLLDQKTAIDAAVNQLKAEGMTEIYRFDFPYDNGKYGYGTGHHPAVGEHHFMAGMLTNYLKKLMGW